MKRKRSLLLYPLALVGLYDPLAERASREIQADQLCSVPCPVCRTPLVTRCRASGPYFHCQCHEGTWNGRRKS